MACDVFLYCIGLADDASVKIGIANDPKKRLAQLQTAHPHKLVIHWSIPFCSREMAVSAERYAHDKLSDSRVGGEWFFVSPQAAKEVADGFAPKKDAPKKHVRPSTFIHPQDDGSEPTVPETNPHWIKRARMSIDERRVFWEHCELEDPPPGYEDWYVFGGTTIMGAFPIKFGPLPEEMP